MCHPIHCYAVVCSFTHHLFTHLKFASHVDMATQISRSAVDTILKRHGVTNNMLSLFYQSRILSILSYASPAWYTFTPQYARDKLEHHQSRCLRIIHPETKSYTERCRLTGISLIQGYLSAQCPYSLLSMDTASGCVTAE